MDETFTCARGELTLMDLEANQTVYRREEKTAFNAVAFAPDGQTTLTGSDDGLLRLWDVQTGEVLREYEGHTGPVYTIAFRPQVSIDGDQTVVSGSADGQLILWDVETGGIIRTFETDDPDTEAIEGHAAQVNTVAFSSDGKQMVSGSGDSTLIIWDVDSGALIYQLAGHGDASVMTVRFVPGSNLVVSGGGDYNIRLWDAVSGEEITPVAAPIGGLVFCLDITPDGQTILACAKDEVHFWNIAQWQEDFWLADNRAEDDGDLLSLAVSDDGTRVIGGTVTNVVRVWNLEEGDEIRRFETDGTALATVAISADSRTLLTGTYDYCGGILWDITTGKAVQRFESAGGEGSWSMGAALFQTPAGPRAAVGCANWGLGGEHRTWLAVFATQTGHELYRLTNHQANIWRMAVSANGEKALSGSTGGELMLWNLNTGKLTRQFDIAAALNSIDLSSDGTRALTSVTGDIDLEEGLILWDVDSGEVIGQYPFEVPLADVVFGPDETSAIVTTSDARIVKIDLATHEIVWQAYPANESWVVRLSPNERYILIRDLNVGTLSLWDAETVRLIQQLGNHHGVPPNVVFSRDSQSFFSAGDDGEIIEWRITDLSVESLYQWVQNNRYIRDFTCRERAQYYVEPLCN